MKKFFNKYWYVFVTACALIFAIAAAVFSVVVLGGSTGVNTTSVGYIGFGNRTDAEEIKSYLSSRVADWKKDTDYSIEYQGIKYQIQTQDPNDETKVNKLSILDFDAEMTYLRARKNVQGNPAYFTRVCHFNFNINQI